jgi:hypothetical protein
VITKASSTQCKRMLQYSILNLPLLSDWIWNKTRDNSVRLPVHTASVEVGRMITESDFEISLFPKANFFCYLFYVFRVLYLHLLRLPNSVAFFWGGGEETLGFNLYTK